MFPYGAHPRNRLDRLKNRREGTWWTAAWGSIVGDNNSCSRSRLVLVVIVLIVVLKVVVVHVFATVVSVTAAVLNMSWRSYREHGEPSTNRRSSFVKVVDRCVIRHGSLHFIKAGSQLAALLPLPSCMRSWISTYVYRHTYKHIHIQRHRYYILLLFTVNQTALVHTCVRALAH